MTYYEILQVRDDASSDVIRAAYKSLIQKFHPDRHPNDFATANMAMVITEAYETLSDARLRAAYDQQLSQSHGGGGLQLAQGIGLAKLSFANALRPRLTAKRAIVVAAVLLLAVALAATFEYRRRSSRDRTQQGIFPPLSAAELVERDKRVVRLFPDKLVLTWPEDDPFAGSQVVVIPEIRVEVARPRFADFKAYFDANRDQIAQDLAADVPKFLRGSRMGSDLDKALLARAMHRSFNQHHPEAIENLCPPGAANLAPGCSGIVSIFFPQEYWVTRAKD